MTLKHFWDPQLSQKEVSLIGLIAVQWGAMEYEVFFQTLATFEGEVAQGVLLPKEMNNLQFTGVLELWKKRVAMAAKVRRSRVLLKQYELILHLKPYRDALVHSMWHWSDSDLGAIFTTRVKKRDVISVKFTNADLDNFAAQIAEINFRIRFPGGVSDLARARMRDGGYISRRAMAMFYGAPINDEGFPVAHPSVASTDSAGDA